MKNKSIKIISVGNDSDNLISLRALIMEAFPLAEVMVADNLDKCLKLVSSEKRDIIFFDSAMLNEDCYKLCKKLKKDKTFCDIPLVFLTSANEDQNSLDTALKCGADAFIKKPIDKICLIAQIHSMMKIRAANLERARVTHLVKEKRQNVLRHSPRIFNFCK